MDGTSIWLSHLHGLNTVATVTAIVIFISSIDDLLLDAYYWAFEIGRMARREKPPSIDVRMLRSLEESPLAIMVPAWKEYDVIARMVENTLATLEYQHYVIFIGTYHNDIETTAEVERMVRRHPGRITRATVLNDGPTCKADCLNWILSAILRYEAMHQIHFSGVVMHDCEDVIHPIELKYFNHAIAEYDFVQLPVLSLPRKWNEFVAGTYMDDFSELHQKDIPSRQRLTGVVPGSGVASCYGRRAIEVMMRDYDGRPFNTDSLTEDYDFSFRLRAAGLKETFARFPLSDDAHDRPTTGASRHKSRRDLLATREYFPSTFRTAYRQRARWILGIAFQGWQQLGWYGNPAVRYMFFRDRKGMVTSIFSVVAYGVLIDYSFLVALQWAGVIDPIDLSDGVTGTWLAPLLAVNSVMLFARLGERCYFVAKLNGPIQGLLALPRLVVNNLINFFAVCRAWRIFVAHLMSGRPIAWDKTAHTYLSNEELGKSRSKLGKILVAWGLLTETQVDIFLQRQAQCGKRLGALLLESGAISAESLADALAEQAGLPRVILSNVAVGHFSESFAFELQYACLAVPFSTAEDGTLNVAVGSPLTEDERNIVQRGAGCNVAYFIACDAQIASALSRHGHFLELERRRGPEDGARRAAAPGSTGGAA